jgi:hypothetical protein
MPSDIFDSNVEMLLQNSVAIPDDYSCDLTRGTVCSGVLSLEINMHAGAGKN